MIDVTLDEENGLAEQLDLFLLDQTIQEIKATKLREELDLIPVEEFATALGLEQQTLAAWRSEGEGPNYVKLGKTVFYQRDSIAEWVGRSIVEPSKKVA